MLLGIFLIAFGIFAPVEHFVFPHPSYGELQTKEIEVESLVYKRIRTGIYEYYITMSNGERYITCGFFDREMDEKLHSGDQVSIKYHDTCIDELKKGEELLVTYADHYKREMGAAIMISVGSTLSGVLFITAYFFSVKNDIRKQENRDKRIQKKYGEKSKIK